MTDRNTPLSSPLPKWLARSPVASGASRLYREVIDRRNTWYRRHPRFVEHVRPPVFSIGGIRAGGTGKTPAVMLLLEILQRQGYTAGVLSRGYKRTGKEPVIVAPEDKVVWEQTGDEPAMIRNASPQAWLGIGSERTANAAVLQERMGDRAVLLLDDGFQHRRLHRDADIVCIHETVFEDRLLPQGYLREPVESLERANVFFLIGTPQQKEQLSAVGERLSVLFPGIPHYLLYQEFAGWVNVHNKTENTELPFEAPVALCGIARPGRFFDLIEASGIKPVRKMAFPDHYRYRDYDFSLLRKLYSHGLITTEKDAVRLSSRVEIPEDCLWYLKVRLQFSENESFNRFNHYIKAVLERKSQLHDSGNNSILKPKEGGTVNEVHHT